MMRRVLIGAALACTIVAIGLLARGHFLEQAVADGRGGNPLRGAAQPSHPPPPAATPAANVPADPGPRTAGSPNAPAGPSGPAHVVGRQAGPGGLPVEQGGPADSATPASGRLGATGPAGRRVESALPTRGPVDAASRTSGSVDAASPTPGPVDAASPTRSPIDAASRTRGSIPAAASELDPARAPSRAAPRTVAMQEPTAETVLERASAAYEAVRSLRADFVQHLTNPLLGTETTSRGTLFQRRPDRFLMRFSEPAGDVIVSDGRYFWVYYPSVDEEQVIRTPAGAGGPGGVDLQAHFLGNPLERFDATLDGREPVAGRDAYVLTLVPRTQAAYERLVVWIDTTDYLARRFEIHGVNGVVRHFELRDLEPNVPLEDELFRFTPPAGAQVIDRR